MPSVMTFVSTRVIQTLLVSLVFCSKYIYYHQGIFDLIWFIHNPGICMWQNTIEHISWEKTAKTRLTRDSEVPGGFPWSKLNHYLKGVWKPSWHDKNKENK